MWKFTVILVLAIASAGQVSAICNQCKNGFACVNETQFQLCFNDTQDKSKTYSCPNSDDVCSQYGQICMPRGAVAPACRGEENCRCDGRPDFQFVCTSRTTFRMCFNETWYGKKGSCQLHQLCDVKRAANGDIPCTNKCIEDVVDASICDFIDPIDELPPVTPPTTNGPATITPPTTVIITPTPPSSANEVCRAQNVAGRYPFPNDTTCTHYVLCQWGATNQLIGIYTACPSSPQQRYFNRDTRSCQVAKPAWCF